MLDISQSKVFINSYNVIINISYRQRGNQYTRRIVYVYKTMTILS